jgi:hypothetical protein
MTRMEKRSLAKCFFATAATNGRVDCRSSVHPELLFLVFAAFAELCIASFASRLPRRSCFVRKARRHSGHFRPSPIRVLGKLIPPGQGKSPFSLDCYLSWMSRIPETPRMMTRDLSELIPTAAEKFALNQRAMRFLLRPSSQYRSIQAVRCPLSDHNSGKKLSSSEGSSVRW